MSTVLVYPFGRESEIISKHSEQLEELQLVCLVGVKGWEHWYKEVLPEYPVVFDFEKAVTDFSPEVIWFVKFWDELEFEKYYLPCIELAVERRISIIVHRDLLKNLSRVKIGRNLFFEATKKIQIQMHSERNFLYPISTPVIYITSLYEGLGKSDLLLCIRKRMRELGISATYIGGNSLTDYFGIYNFPNEMFQNNVSDRDKVMLFNAYLKEIEQKEKPDLIVVSIPGEMFCISKNYLANMGFLAQDCFMAATPDIVITNLPYGRYLKENLEIIEDMIFRRFGTKIDVMCRTNNRLLLQDTEMEQKCSYLTITGGDATDVGGIEGFFDFTDENIITIVDECLDKLYGYGEIVSI